MPTYDYVCKSCDHAFEHFQSMTTSPLKKCPACGKMQLKRLIGTGAGIIFKGSGFYETDYRSSEYKQKAKQENEGGSDSKSDSTSKSDATTGSSDSSNTGSASKSDNAGKSDSGGGAPSSKSNGGESTKSKQADG